MRIYSLSAKDSRPLKSSPKNIWVEKLDRFLRSVHLKSVTLSGEGGQNKMAGKMAELVLRSEHSPICIMHIQK